MTLSLRTDRRLINAEGSSVRYLLAEISAPEAPPRENRLPVNVAFVLDRSGSMRGESKFPLAVEAITKALSMLDKDDRFSLVVFDEHVDVLAHSANATSDAKRLALSALREISPRGSTDLCSGWMHGCDEIAAFLESGTVARALLLTDGLANHGTINPEVLVTHARELRERGIATSTFGVGADFDERLLRDMASAGGGNFYFIDSADQISDLMTSELGEALEVVLPHAMLEIAVPHGAKAELMNGFRTEWRGRSTLRIFLGDLVSGQVLRLVVRVRFQHGVVGDILETSASLKCDGPDYLGHTDILNWTFANRESNGTQPRVVPVDREVATIYAARARSEATEANRDGDLDRARRVLERTASRIQRYANGDQVLHKIAEDLVREVPRFARIQMSARTLKSAFYAAELSVRERGIDGKAKRGSLR